MNRRRFIGAFGGALLARPLQPVYAQQPAAPVIGTLSGRSRSDTGALFAAFRSGLGETGYIEGHNLAIEYRWAEGHYDRFPALAADLVGHKVAVIAAVGGATSALAAKAATATTPIVFFTGSDPVQEGLVANLARPGGNLTGVSIELGELTSKRLELLSELIPQAKTVALLVNPNNANTAHIVEEGQQAARARGLQIVVLKATDPHEIDAAFANLAGLHSNAVVVGSDPFLSQRREQLVTLAERYAVAAIYPQREFAGGLISYAPSFTDGLRLVGTYCGKILNGAKPADLPVQQPTKFELVINLKTAEALGLTVPPSLLARADEVIE